MKKLLAIFLIFPLAVFAATNTIIQTSGGTYNWTAPAGVTTVQVSLWGGGGNGGGLTTDNTICRGGGGAGGQFARKNVTVSPGTNYTYIVSNHFSNGSGNGSNGTDSSFNSTTVIAKGGAGGLSYENGGTGGVGSTTGGVGDVVYPGGNGSNGGAVSTGGAGGGGAGTTGAGGNATANTAGTGTTLSGGTGAAGRTTAGDGQAPSVAGGGAGSGANIANNTSIDRNGGTAAVGRAELTYTIPSSRLIVINDD